MKCRKDQECWFCSNRCDICFKILGFDAIKRQVNQLDVSVCKQNCAWYLPGREIQTKVIVANPGEPPPPCYEDRSCPLFASHKKYFHVYIQATTDDFPLKIDIAVCLGDGSTQYPENQMYGVYYARSMHKQELFDFVLSDSFNLLCPLPYDKSNRLLASVIQKHEVDGSIGHFLRLAYNELKETQ